MTKFLDRDTQNKQTAQTQSSGDVFKVIFNCALSPILATNKKGIVTEFNEAASTAFGYSPDEIKGEDVRTLIPHHLREAHPGYIKEYLKTGKSNVVGCAREVTGIRKNGEEFPILLQVSRVKVSNEVSFIAVTQDLSEIKLMQAQLIQSAKLANLGELTAGVAHEINNPLFFVNGFNQMCTNTLKEKHPDAFLLVEDFLSSVNTNSIRIQNIVKQFKNFARKSDNIFIENDLDEVFNGIFLLLSDNFRQANIEVKKDIHPGLVINGDSNQLEQVIFNLFSNAKDSIEDLHGMQGGIVSIEGYYTDDITVIKISDNGKGIDESKLNRIFDPFYTTKEVGKGTGLGLSITHRIIENHGGTITCQSSPNNGASFTIKFPRINCHTIPKAS